MQVQRQILEVTRREVTIELPASFVNHQVEIIALTVDEERPVRRRPHPDIAGKVTIRGDIFSSVPESDWDVPR
jgi:hypothetical protein